MACEDPPRSDIGVSLRRRGQFGEFCGFRGTFRASPRLSRYSLTDRGTFLQSRRSQAPSLALGTDKFHRVQGSLEWIGPPSRFALTHLRKAFLCATKLGFLKCIQFVGLALAGTGRDHGNHTEAKSIKQNLGE